jgi:hypothetical protein
MQVLLLCLEVLLLLLLRRLVVDSAHVLLHSIFTVRMCLRRGRDSRHHRKSASAIVGVEVLG